MGFMQKLLGFPDQIGQDLSNAPTPMYFGPKLDEYDELQVYRPVFFLLQKKTVRK